MSISYNHEVKSISLGNNAKSTPTRPPESSNRIFVAGISETCTEQIIYSTFSKFGSITDITILGKRSNRRELNPYCFISYHDAESAQRALAAPKPDSENTPPFQGIYTEVRNANPVEVRRRSNQSRSREIERKSEIERISRNASLILQVQSTHLSRLVDHLNRWIDTRKDGSHINDGMGQVRVLGSTRANIKNTSLLFIHTQGNPIPLSRMLCLDPNLARALNKSYIVQSMVKGSVATEQDCRSLAKTLLDKVISDQEQDSADVQRSQRTLRIQLFPRKQQSQFLTSFDAVLEDNSNICSDITIAPNGFTHMLSVVQIYQYQGKRQDERDDLYMIGISPASFELDVIDTNNKHITNDGRGDDVNRAYFKLKEAFHRYEADYGKVNEELEGSIALDCGSAPGGWTKYLIQHLNCDQVFSVDPGILSPSILELKATSHMQMKIQDALPILRIKGKDKIGTEGKLKIWVSDMCLHEMKDQVEILLLAKEQGLLAPNTFFVLTLKCIVGRSKEYFDTQVEQVVEKLRAAANVDRVATYHLFSNRSGERTVMGYIN